MNLVHNEQVKLLATTLNNTGIASVVTGFIAPMTNLLYGSVSVGSGEKVVAITAAWLSSGMILIVAGRRTLRGLRE